MNVYVLKGSKGEYEDYVAFVIGVYSSESNAIAAREDYLKLNEQIKESPCPISEELYEKQDWYYLVSDDDYWKTIDWISNVNNAKSLNGVWINETELDKQVTIDLFELK